MLNRQAALSFATCAFMIAAVPQRARASEDAAPADFADIALDDLLTVEVTTVSKHEESLGAAPATISVISREDIARHGYTSVADALGAVPGLYVGYGRDYHYVGVRGVGLPLDTGTRVLVLLDGHTMNNPYSGASYLDELLSLPIEAVERIEIIRGPSSSIYGASAFLAVINVVSRTPLAEGEAKSRAGVGWSSLGRYRAAGSLNERLGDLKLAAYALAVSGDGPRLRFDDMTRPSLSSPSPTPTGGVTHGTDFERGYNVGASGTVGGLTLLAHWAARLKGLPLAPGGAIFDDPYNSAQDTHAFAEARYRLELGRQAVLARAYADRFRHRVYLHRDPTDWDAGRFFGNDPRSVSEGNDDTQGIELQGTLALHDTDTLLAGVELQRHSVSQPTYELDLAGAAIAESRRGGVRQADGSIAPISSQNAGVYLQNDWRPLATVGIVAGVRYDYSSLFSGSSGSDLRDTISPRAAVVFTPMPTVSVKLMYGEAFRNPSVREAFFDDGVSVCGNPQARPEKQRTLELGGLWSPLANVSLGASMFATGMTDMLKQQLVSECYVGSGPRLRFINQGSVQALGAEGSATARLSGGTQVSATLGVWRVREGSLRNAADLANSPPVIAGAGAVVPLWQQRLFASARLRYIDERLTWRLGDAATEPRLLTLDAALVMRDVWAGLEASLSVTNALGTRYRDAVTASESIPAAVLQDGRAAYVQVSYVW